MSGQLFILVDREPVAVEPDVWQAWMEDADRVVDHSESHTPHRVWTLTTYFLGLEQRDELGRPHMFATVYERGPAPDQLEQFGPVRLARDWATAEASHAQVLGQLRGRYRGTEA